jgi:hypothetical protein
MSKSEHNTDDRNDKPPLWAFAMGASRLLELGAHPSLWTDTWPPNSTAILAEGIHRGVKCWIQ